MGDREDKGNGGGWYEAGLFELLLKLTKHLPFSNMKNEPLTESREVLQRRALKQLFVYIRWAVKRAYSKMPVELRKVEGLEDWLQEAFKLLYFETVAYKPVADLYYDKYMKFLVIKRLKGKQRATFAKNPTEDEKLRKLAARLEQQTGREATPEEIARHGNVSIEKAREFLDFGPGPRVFQEWNDVRDENFIEKDDEDDAYGSPEKACLREECRQILLDCIETLPPYQRGIFIERYLLEESFPAIAARRGGKEVEAVRGQARRGLELVRQCVLRRCKAGNQE